ncbi:MAG TPA: vitamin K epoxide reductase family protein [Ferruginibacter sp.]|nr:vitamin K epoxide reductase family protein [Ferruginibacter sp.]
MKTNASYPGELWQTTHKWLLISGNKANAKYCREEISTHPDYPAMTAVTDFLDRGNMTFNAVQADASYIHEFNYPVLAHIRQPGQEYMHIITHPTEWDRQKDITQHWTGITLFPEKDAKWGNEENNIYQRNTFKNRLFITALILTGIVVFIFSAFKASNAGHLFFGLFSLAGLITSIVLLGTELGYQSQIVKQVCGAVSNGGCEKVLKSKYAKGFLGITPADASVIYFGTQFIVYLLGTYFVFLIPSLMLIALCGFGIVAWSIYTQAVKLKQWCVLCLAIASVLMSQGVITLLNTNFQNPLLPSLTSFLLFIFTSGILGLAFFPVKQLMKANKSNQQKLAELKKWKTDVHLFITQWQQEQKVDTTIWKNDLLIGNPEAPLLITVACNPYCGPCAKAHYQLDKLLERFEGKLAIQIRLLWMPDFKNNTRQIAAKGILQKASSITSSHELKNILTDWFDLMDYDLWSKKWRPNNNIIVTESLKKHAHWIEENRITSTPTIFVNGRKLPGRYNLEDLQLLIPNLTEVIKISIN